jgi:chromosome segregation ATPase
MPEPRPQSEGRREQIRLKEAIEILNRYLKLYRKYIVVTFEVDSERHLPFVYDRKNDRKMDEDIFRKERVEERVREAQNRQKEILSEIEKMRKEQPWLSEAEEYINKKREQRALEERLRELEGGLSRIEGLESTETGESIEQVRERMSEESEQYKGLRREIEDARRRLESLNSEIKGLERRFPTRMLEILENEANGNALRWEEHCIPYLNAYERRNRTALETMEENNPYLRLLQYYISLWLEIRDFQKENRQPEEYAYFVDRIERISTYFSPEIRRSLEDYLNEKYSKT